MSENFDRRRSTPVPQEKPRLKRDIRFEQVEIGKERRNQFVRCDGEFHVTEIETISYDSNGVPEFGYYQLADKSVPCTCSDEEKARGDSMWDVFK